MAPQNIPCGIVLTLGNKVGLYCIVREARAGVVSGTRPKRPRVTARPAVALDGVFYIESR